MKRLCLIFSILLLKTGAFAQIEHPVTWSYAAKRINKTEAIILLKATIEPGWHIYSTKLKDGGPVKTSFTFKKSSSYSVSGSILEPGPITHFEKSFNMEVSYFENTVVFQQKIKLKNTVVSVKGQVEYMTCNDHKCLPPDDVEFTIPVK